MVAQQTTVDKTPVELVFLGCHLAGVNPFIAMGQATSTFFISCFLFIMLNSIYIIFVHKIIFKFKG